MLTFLNKNKAIKFKISEDETKIFEKFFLDKENFFNLYFTQYKSYEMEHTIQKPIVEKFIAHVPKSVNFISPLFIFPRFLCSYCPVASISLPPKVTLQKLP